MRNTGLEETQAGIQIAGRNINNLRYADDTTLMARKWRGTQSLLMKVKVESEKVGLNSTFRKRRSCIWSHHFMANRWGNSGNSVRLYFWGAPKSLQMVTAAMKLKEHTPWKKNYDQPRQHIKKQRCYFVNKGPSSQSYGFSSGHVWMWELDCEESWALKNWCFWTVVLEKALESPLDCKEIQPVHSKGDQSWVFIGRTDVEAETPVLWPPDVKSWLLWKDPDAGKDWRQERKGLQRMK